MIYKFKKGEQSSILEVEHITEVENIGIVELSILNPNVDTSISLYKDDVYKLIGALHLLHKEMK